MWLSSGEWIIMDFLLLNQMEEFEIDSATKEQTIKHLKNTFTVILRSEIRKKIIM